MSGDVTNVYAKLVSATHAKGLLGKAHQRREGLLCSKSKGKDAVDVYHGPGIFAGFHNLKHRLLLMQKMPAVFLPSLLPGQQSGASMPKNAFLIGAVNGIVILVNVICYCGQDQIQLTRALEVPWTPWVDKMPPPLDCREQIF